MKNVRDDQSTWVNQFFPPLKYHSPCFSLMESNALKRNLSQGLSHVRSAQISRPTIVAVCSDKILIYGFQEEYFGHLEKGKACDTHLLLTPEVRRHINLESSNTCEDQTFQKVN